MLNLKPSFFLNVTSHSCNNGRQRTQHRRQHHAHQHNITHINTTSRTSTQHHAHQHNITHINTTSHDQTIQHQLSYRLFLTLTPTTKLGSKFLQIPFAIHPSIHLSIHPSTHPSPVLTAIHPSIHPSSWWELNKLPIYTFHWVLHSFTVSFLSSLIHRHRYHSYHLSLSHQKYPSIHPSIGQSIRNPS